MADLSRIEKTFYLHPKAKKARGLEPGSLSLWLICNCWCRDHRMQGFVPRDTALSMGTIAEIKALVDSRLWVEVEHGYEFKDWGNWNPDTLRSGSRSTAGHLVWEVLGGHPEGVRMRLAQEVEKLFDEGVSVDVVEAALKIWGERPGAKVIWLGYYVSDVIRQGESGIAGALKKARATGDVKPLAAFGFRWYAPDAPSPISARALREFMHNKKMAWLDTIEAGLNGAATK